MKQSYCIDPQRLWFSVSVFLFALYLLTFSLSFAQSVPQLVNYQGKLTDASGQPLATQEYSISFSIFATASGGTAIWGPQIFDSLPGIGHRAKVPVVQGHFNVILGPKDVWDKNITGAFVSEETYLEIAIDGGSPISPRQRILSTPYAVQAERARHGVPAGTVFPFAGNEAPIGYLLCDGRALSRETYAELWSVIGTIYGIGDGTTTFNVPDLRGRLPLGKDSMGGMSANRVTAIEADSLGGSLGEENHKLTIAEMPSHTHKIGKKKYEFTHWGGYGDPNSWQDYSTWDIDSKSAGGDNPHNNMPPYLTLTYIIKY